MRFDLERRVFAEHSDDPEAPAIVTGSGVLSWGEFQSAVQNWVDRAKVAGVSRDVPLVIYGHKEANYFIAMTGCLVMGAPFVPVDTIYPAERYERIRKISGAEFSYLTDTDRFMPTGNPARSGPLERGLAYIIFTSGSTGEPKGVQIGQEGVVSLVAWMKQQFKLGQKPVFMNQAPFSFDLSMYEVMGTLSLGGCCVLNDRQLINQPEEFLQRQHDSAITCWVSTPSFAYQQLLNKRFSAEFLPTLRTFLFCGEPLGHGVAKRLKERFPGCELINTYGPTEATVATTWIFIDDEVLSMHNPLPVGYGKPDGYVFLDADNDELCIAGDHVMRGYLNSPELNARKMFEYKGYRAFRTGDLGEIDAHGLIFCRGRIDDQIKLNGYRIELTEIDRSLLNIDGVSNAAAVALRRPDETVGRLLGFIVPDAALSDEAGARFLDECKEKLRQVLPEYMVPSELVLTTSLPVSVNFKVDRKALAEVYKKGL